MLLAWGFFDLWIKERETGMLACKLIGIMDSVVTILAEGSFICSAEYGSCFFPTNITLNLHSVSQVCVLLMSLNVHSFSCMFFVCVFGVRVCKKIFKVNVMLRESIKKWLVTFGRIE